MLPSDRDVDGRSEELTGPYACADYMRMPTISVEQLGHVDSRQIAIGAPREAVIALLADARRLPEWAPAFAQAVAPEGQHWRVDLGGGAEVVIDVVVDEERGTIDLVRPGDPTTGAKLRVLHNGAGCAFVFSIVFPPGTPDDAIAAQMATIEEELRTVRALAEAEAAA